MSRAPCHLGHRLGQLGLAGAGRALDEDRLAEPIGQVHDAGDALVGEVVDPAGQERGGHVGVHHERLGRVAHRRALGLGVDHDVAAMSRSARRRRRRGSCRRRRSRRARWRCRGSPDQRRAAAGDQAVDDSAQLHELDGRLAAGVLDQHHASAGRPALATASRSTAAMADVGRDGPRRAPQERGVARLQAQPERVAGDVGPVLVDDGHDAERHPHREMRRPLGRVQPSMTSPTGSGSDRPPGAGPPAMASMRPRRGGAGRGRWPVGGPRILGRWPRRRGVGGEDLGARRSSRPSASW
jgi:hypothetical protein